MAGVSWKIGGPVPPMPYRSVVDGSVVDGPTGLPMPGFTPNVIWIPLDAGSRELFLRHGRRWRDASSWWAKLIYAAFIATVSTQFRWPGAHYTWGLAAVVFCYGPRVLHEVLATRRPPQYPRPLGNRMVLRDVHPETVRAWQEVAGPAVEIDTAPG